MPPLDAPVFMAPLSGMMFLFGAIVHQFAGGIAVDSKDFVLWFGLSAVGLALQIGAFLILISL